MKPLGITSLSVHFCRSQTLCLIALLGAQTLQEVVTTPEMQAGLAVHAKLQAEVVQVVDVAVATPEDAWGLKLLGTIQGLHQLLSEGMTRELYIFGSLQVQQSFVDTSLAGWHA